MQKADKKIANLIATLTRAIQVKNEIIAMLKKQSAVDNAPRILEFEKQIAAANAQIVDLQAILQAFNDLQAGVANMQAPGVDVFGGGKCTSAVEKER